MQVLTTFLIMAAVLSRYLTYYDRPSIQSINCAGESIFNNLPHSYEPSDLAISPSRTLLVVSDNGKLAELNQTGELLRKYSIDGKPDLEAIAIMPSLWPDCILIGVEFPTAIIQFNLTSSSIVHTIILPELYDENSSLKRKKQGLESIVTFQSGNESYLVGGRQHDSRLFVYTLTVTDGRIQLSYQEQFQPPGPNYDLSAMTVWNSHLFLMYDKAFQIQSLHFSQLLDLMGESSDNTSSTASTMGTLRGRQRGWEGIAFGEELVFIAVDPKRGKGKKDLRRWLIKDFFSCFGEPGIRLE